MDWHVRCLTFASQESADQPRFKMLRISIFALTLFAFADFGFAQSVSYEGLVTPIHNTIVASEEPGVVRDLSVETGDIVAESAMLAKLNSEMFEAELAVAVEELAIANLRAKNDVNVVFAEKSFEVNNKILERSKRARTAYANSVSTTELEQVKLEVDQAELSARQAEMEQEIAVRTYDLQGRKLDVASVRLANRKINSPFTGHVAQLYVQKGQWVNAGDPIARVIDLKTLRVKVLIEQDYLFRITEDSKATFEFRIGSSRSTIPAKVVFVGREVSEGLFQVWADLENSEEKVVPGIRGMLTIDVE